MISAFTKPRFGQPSLGTPAGPAQVDACNTWMHMVTEENGLLAAGTMVVSGVQNNDLKMARIADPTDTASFTDASKLTWTPGLGGSTSVGDIWHIWEDCSHWLVYADAADPPTTLNLIQVKWDSASSEYAVVGGPWLVTDTANPTLGLAPYGTYGYLALNDPFIMKGRGKRVVIGISDKRPPDNQGLLLVEVYSSTSSKGAVGTLAALYRFGGGDSTAAGESLVSDGGASGWRGAEELGGVLGIRNRVVVSTSLAPGGPVASVYVYDFDTSWTVASAYLPSISMAGTAGGDYYAMGTLQSFASAAGNYYLLTCKYRSTASSFSSDHGAIVRQWFGPGLYSGATSMPMETVDAGPSNRPHTYLWTTGWKTYLLTCWSRDTNDQYVQIEEVG